MSSEGGRLAQLWCIHTGACFGCSEGWRADALQHGWACRERSQTQKPVTVGFPSQDRSKVSRCVETEQIGVARDQGMGSGVESTWRAGVSWGDGDVP